MSIAAEQKSAEPVPAIAAAPPRRLDNAWLWQVTALSILLGGMLALAVRTTEKGRTSTNPGGSRFNLLAEMIKGEKDKASRLQEEVSALRRQKDEALRRIQGDQGVSQQLKEEFQSVRQQAGLLAVEGAGIVVTIRDSPETPPENEPFEDYLVHDQDLNNILSVLKAAGAQQLAISGADSTKPQRVVVSTTARCVGPTAVVNGTYLSAPFHIFAIGDAKALREALERPDGYVRGQRRLEAKKMIEVSDAPKMVFPEYSGKLQARYTNPIPTPKAEEGEDGSR